VTAQWFYGRSGQQNGPVPTEQLRQLVASGQVQPTDLIWKEGMASWVPATELEQLAAAEPTTSDGARQLAEGVLARFDLLTGGRIKSGWLKVGIGIVAAIVVFFFFRLILLLAAISGGIALACYWKRLTARTRWIGVSVVATLLILWFAVGGEHADVTMVKTGHLSAHPNIPVGKAIDHFMSGTRWEAVTGENGKNYVNVRGRVTFMDKSVEAALQFLVDHKDEAFEANAFEMNGVPQNAFMMAAFIEKMFDEYEK